MLNVDGFIIINIMMLMMLIMLLLMMMMIMFTMLLMTLILEEFRYDAFFSPQAKRMASKKHDLLRKNLSVEVNSFSKTHACSRQISYDGV